MSQIVISGAAVATCLGAERGVVWQAVKEGRCGTRAYSVMESPLPPGTDGGQAVELPGDGESAGPREVRYLRHVLRDALADAGLAGQPVQFPYPRHRCGIILGTTLHGMRGGGEYLRSGNADVLRHFLSGSIARSAAEGLGLRGPTLTTCSACSSSLGSIALAVTLLRAGQLDLVAAGGYDPISEYVYAGFSSLRLVASGALRPFARDRAGMKVGEGYGIVILERAAEVKKRGWRKALARIAGFGESADAHHLTQPHPEGEGAARAIESALRAAGLRPGDIDLIAAHATATPDNDAAEYAALRRIWGEDLPRVPVVAFKSHLSHTLGAAGAVELILSAMAVAEQTVPPCANVAAGDTDFPGLNLAAGAARPSRIGAALNLSLGFGGANTAMVITPPRPPVDERISIDRRRDVLISGIGVVFPGAIGNQAFAGRFRHPAARLLRDTPDIDEAQIALLLNARRVRRMSSYVKLSLASAVLALRDAGVNDPAEFGQSCAALLGTTHGSVSYCHEYYSQIVRGGIAAANPMLFAEGVPNAAAAHLSLALGIKGGCQTIVGSRTAGLDALGLAATRIRLGEWDRAIVAAAEEYSPIANSIYAHCGLYAAEHPAEPFAGRGGTFVAGCGAVTFVLESRASLEARGGSARGSVQKYSSVSPDEGGQIESASQVLADLADPAAVLSSANGTWIDRVEAEAMRRSAVRAGRIPSVTCACGYLAECFSAGPLAAAAAVLLNGKLPPLFGPGLSWADAGESFDHFAALATDYTGLVSGVRVGLNRGGLAV